jgi:hypothetical protein
MTIGMYHQISTDSAYLRWYETYVANKDPSI